MIKSTIAADVRELSPRPSKRPPNDRDRVFGRYPRRPNLPTPCHGYRYKRRELERKGYGCALEAIPYPSRRPECGESKGGVRTLSPEKGSIGDKKSRTGLSQVWTLRERRASDLNTNGK